MSQHVSINLTPRLILTMYRNVLFSNELTLHVPTCRYNPYPSTYKRHFIAVYLRFLLQMLGTRSSAEYLYTVYIRVCMYISTKIYYSFLSFRCAGVCKCAIFEIDVYRTHVHTHANANIANIYNFSRDPLGRAQVSKYKVYRIEATFRDLIFAFISSKPFSKEKNHEIAARKRLG